MKDFLWKATDAILTTLLILALVASTLLAIILPFFAIGWVFVFILNLFGLGLDSGFWLDTLFGGIILIGLVWKFK